MRWQRTLQIVEAHCGGEVGKVVTSPLFDLPGATMLDRMNHINHVDDRLRRLLTLEPRGSAAMSVNLLLPPVRADAQAGFFVLQADRAHPMSGSNAICVTTVLLETGILPAGEGETIVALDTPAGLVRARACMEAGRCRTVTLDMPRSFVQDLDVTIDTERYGKVTADIAFGGCFYVLVDPAQLGLSITPARAPDLVAAGVALKAEFERAVPVRHPEIPDLDEIAYVMFRQADPAGGYRTGTILKPGRLDRSACGTGSSALLATLDRRGDLAPGATFTARSIIGGEFQVGHQGHARVGNVAAVRPTITGAAWIHGISQTGLDPTDPFPEGFALGDVWGPAAADLPGAF